MITLALAAFFPKAGHVAAWGVLIAGCLELALVAGDTAWSDVIAKFRHPRWDADVKRFFVALGPAVIGSAPVQLPLFPVTLLPSFPPPGPLYAPYSAPPLHHRPLRLIGH